MAIRVGPEASDASDLSCGMPGAIQPLPNIWLPSAAVLLVHSNAASLPMPAATLASVVPSRCVSSPLGRFTLCDVRSSFKGQPPEQGSPVLPGSSSGLGRCPGCDGGDGGATTVLKSMSRV